MSRSCQHWQFQTKQAGFRNWTNMDRKTPDFR